jgi:hypothetical protein
MTDQHRATPEQEINELIAVTVYGPDGGDTPSVASAWEVAKLISGLTARIEALEAAQLEQAESNRFCVDAIVRRVEALESPMAELRAASAEARTGGLVERVANAIYNVPHDSAAEARAAIREVAAASADENPFDSLNEAAEHHGWDAAVGWLEQEADRG